MTPPEADLPAATSSVVTLVDVVMQQHVQRLRAAQTRMLVLSEQVSVAELASEMSEARAKLIEVNCSGIPRILCAMFSIPGVD